MTLKKTAVICLASSLLISAGISGCQGALGREIASAKQSTNQSAQEAAPQAAKIDRARCKEYLDEMWVRITRTWGIADKKSSDFDVVSVTFDLDHKGNVSNVAIEKNSAGVVVNQRLKKTIEECSPFPPLPVKATKNSHIKCKVQSREGVLSLDIQVPEFGLANTQNVGVIADADLVQGLIDTVRSGDDETKRSALQDLRDLGVRAKPALSVILEATKDKDTSTMYTAFEALASLGPAAKPALPDMMKYMKGSDDQVREQAVNVIGAIGADAEESIPVLLEALDDNDSTVKHNAAKALRGMGHTVSQKAVSTLMQSAFHEYITFVPEIVAEFGADAVPALVKGTEDSDGHMVHHSVEALQKMGDAAAPAVPALVKLIDSNIGGESEDCAIETLGGLGALAKEAVPTLITTIQSGGEDFRWRAIDALGSIGPDARAAIPALKQYLSGDPDLRRRAKEAIRKIESANN